VCDYRMPTPTAATATTSSERVTNGDSSRSLDKDNQKTLINADQQQVC